MSFPIACWGDSLTQGQGGTPYPTTLALDTGLSVYNGGVGGETSSQIAARMLADTDKHPDSTIIWAGRNNWSQPDVVRQDIAAMVNTLGHERFVILSILNNDTPQEYVGQPDYNDIIALNDSLQSTYGIHYWDVRQFLVNSYDPNDPTDVLNHSEDVPPNSLRSDALHLNTAGYTLVANYIAQHLLGILEPQPITLMSLKPVLPGGFVNVPTVSPGIGGSTGGTDNAILRANGSGGATAQGSAAIVNDDGSITVPGGNFVNLLSTIQTGGLGMRMFMFFDGSVGASGLDIQNADGTNLIKLYPALVVLPVLPTSDPGISGALYTAAGVVMQSP